MNPHTANRFVRAVDLIEARLAEPLTLADIAAAAHLSEFHFARAFRALSGDTVMNYLRRRRLQHAVDRLRDPAAGTLLEIAIDCGFGSHEAFTRAFQREYGIAPSTFRRNAHTLHLNQHRRLSMASFDWNTPPAPTFVDLPSFFAMGLADEFEPGQTDRIGALWGRFVREWQRIPERIGDETYGICFPLERERDCDRFGYVAAVKVGSLAEVPEGMTGVTVPAARYAVFSHTSGLGPALGRTMRYIFGEWLPSSGFTLGEPDFELYDCRFDPATGSGEMFIYVPVQ